ncbi:hypothetical protein PVAP13_3KG248827 [Panicum virgatum]|uniref:Pentatricopeptide repeat-containing protein n=1 Tax=Panicum virgatum TaxID=38727 RepID=A0A8T0UWG9_PANVG|nr:hypothetical protein PVAP13_3KG248827 [Panicum virgatum]
MHQRCRRRLRPLCFLRRGIHSTSVPTPADAATDATLLGRLTCLLLLHRFSAAARLLSSSVPLTPAVLHAALSRVRLDPDAALHLFRLAPSRPSLLAHAQLLHILARARRSADARALLASLLSAQPPAPPLFPHLVEVYKDFTFSADSFDLLLRALANAGHLDGALQVFDEMTKLGCCPTVRSCNSMLNLTEAGDLGTVMSVFEQMQRAWTLPDKFTVAIMAKAYCRDRGVAHAVEFVEEMKKMSVEVNLVAYHAVMNGYCEVGQTEDARRVFESLPSRGLSPNVVTYTMLVKGYCKEDKVEEAEGIIREIRKNKQISVDEVAYGAVMNGYCQKGQMEDAARLQNEMTNVGFQVNLFVYNTVINGYCKLGRMVEAHKVLHEMENAGVRPDPYSYNSLVDGYCRKGLMSNAFEICDTMVRNGFAVTIVTYNALLKGFFLLGSIDDALKLWFFMLKRGIAADEISCSTMVDGFFKAGKTQKALNLWKETFARGLVKTQLHLTWLPMGCVIMGGCMKQ